MELDGEPKIPAHQQAVATSGDEAKADVAAEVADSAQKLDEAQAE